MARIDKNDSCALGNNADAILLGYKSVLDKVALALPLSEIFNSAITWLEAARPGSLASVLLSDEDHINSHSVVAPNLPPSFLEAAKNIPINSLTPVDRSAAFRREPILVWDIMEDPLWSKFRDFAKSAQLRACWGHPIFSNSNDVLGCFLLFLSEPCMPSDYELEVLGSAAHITGIAIERKKFEERLIREKEKAEAATLAKSRFLANVSHEIRTPMNGILGMTELAIEKASDKEQQYYLSLVKQSAETLLGLINEILDFSKIEAGKMNLLEESFSLESVINGLFNLFSSKADRDNLILIQKIDDNVPRFLNGDQAKIAQILCNLISNGIKFSNCRGAIFIWVGLVKCELDVAHLHISVSDTGIGIEQDKLASIFDSFTQADPSTTRRYGGTGLGLAICKQLSLLMGGDIFVRSKPGIGTTFHINIPMKICYAQELPQTSDISSTKIPDQRFMNQRVLLAEDNAINARLAEKFLEKRGFQVTVVTNGRDALTQVLNNSFQLVILDCQMPEMDGFETATAIRNSDNSQARNIPIIAMTAGASEDDRDRCINAGMDGFLSKPFKKEDFWQIVDNLMLEKTH